ncbi:copper amine oxidase N-terminal domain-containing protein [Aneurinibacillus thermoaerophilus]|uniref:Copper amine oxidase N-terminal domain-containing protein n=1 Tax=Aneurinibacillus thermoaerophilus TaxID=143495 RepID=A0ABX8YC10_ANETH|nr:copper amine oxidase N-terminal domain-containing protein [Aneurinibacillus thermoaerophilus]QYY42538.1 copper amine oxidase N-terminal domain-containing protein [Aneurinibacillus thermoaerophilus]
MKTNKALKVLTTSALLASLAAPFAAPASANSSNLVDKILNVNNNSKLSGTSYLYVNEDDIDFSTGDTFRVVLPSGAKWDEEAIKNASDTNSNGISAYDSKDHSFKITTGGNVVKATLRTEKDLEVKLEDGFVEKNQSDRIKIPLYVKLDGASGELKLKIEAMDSTITSEEKVFAIASSGKTITSVDEVKSIGKTGDGGRIRIEENSFGALKGAQSLKLKLPSNFKWNGMVKTDVTLGGGYAGNDKYTVEPSSDNELIINFENLPDTSNSGNRGYIYITPHIKADSDAAKGEVRVNISGGDFSDADVTVAKYGDYNVDVKVEKVEELVAGKFDEYTKTAKITIEETVPGSLVAGRDVDVLFPSWVKVVNVSDWNVSGPIKANKPEVGINGEVDGTDDEFSFTIEENNGGKSSSTVGKIEFKVALSVEANKTGDIEATIKGGGIEERKVVVAKAVAPAAVSVEGDTAKLRIGAQDQEGPTFYITEAKKGVFEKNHENGKGGTGEIVVKLADGVKFSKVPKVEVVEGDGTIDSSNIRRINNDNALAIPVKGESTSKPMKLKVSDVRLTLDRTVPEGDIEAKIGGSAVVENYVNESNGWVGTSINKVSNKTPGTFNTQNAVTFKIGSTITPAPSDTTAKNIVFKLNSKTYTVDGKEFEMDAAPLVGWDRAYLPVRFAANALNVSDDQIIWDDKTSTFTIFKGDRVISGKVGDKFLTINGVKTPMDVPVWRNKEKTNNRVMVPIRYLANALNAEINWNKETSEITIQVK